MTRLDVLKAKARRLKLSRRTLGGIGLAVLALTALSLIPYALNLVQEDVVWKRIQERKVFTVATDASYPPFAAIDIEGNLFGFDIDLAEAIGRRWGVKVEFETLAYDALLGSVVSARDDAVISAFVAQPDRMKEVAFSRPYFTSGMVLVVRQGEAAPAVKDWQAQGPTWASGKTLAVERGAQGDGLARQWARHAVDLTVLSQPTAEEALLAVENRAVDAALVDLVDAYNFLRGHPTLTVVQPPVEAAKSYTVAVSARSRLLAQEVEKALQALEADGTLSGLRVKWFGEAAR